MKNNAKHARLALLIAFALQLIIVSSAQAQTPTPPAATSTDFSSLNDGWSILVAIWGWPLIILFLGLLFAVPLYRLLSSAATYLGRTKIRIGESFEWSVAHVEEAIIEREVLKLAIQLAAADKDINESEKQYLMRRANLMTGNLQGLSNDDKRKVLQEVINMATIDGKVQNEEYRTFRSWAKEFGIKGPELDSLLVESCIRSNAEPPDQLRSKFDQRKQDLERPQ